MRGTHPLPIDWTGQSKASNNTTLQRKGVEPTTLISFKSPWGSVEILYA